MLGIEATVNLSLNELNRLRAQQEKQSSTMAQLAALVRDRSVYARLARLPPVSAVKEVLPRSAIERVKGLVYGSVDHGLSTGERRGDPPKAMHVWSELDAALQSGKTIVSTDKAARLIGFKPHVDFESGMKLTKAWAKWANLLD